MSRARVEGVFVGSELLAGRVNTHESWLGLQLRALGLSLDRATTVPDDLNTIAAALADALGRCDALLVCGGLGPTFDDVTREAAAMALGRKLAFDKGLWSGIEKKLARHKIAIPEENKRQAYLLEGAKALANDFGSAPGQLVVVPRAGRAPQLLALLPGPYPEMAPMFEGAVLPALRKTYAKGLHAEHFIVRLSGVPESVADEKLAFLTREPKEGESFTILAGQGQVEFHATVVDKTLAKAEKRSKALKRKVLEAVGKWAFGEDDATLESAVGEAVLDRGWTLAVAESCTGGGIGAKLTSVPGASRWFYGGVIAYDNSAKTKLLGVAPEMLKREGAVSAECAKQMAEGARKALGTSLGLAVTGIAGPDGGTKEKPVGLVYVAIAGPGDRKPLALELRLGSGREAVRMRAAAAALTLALRRCGEFARASP